jgi:hypothetical protein
MTLLLSGNLFHTRQRNMNHDLRAQWAREDGDDFVNSMCIQEHMEYYSMQCDLSCHESGSEEEIDLAVELSLQRREIDLEADFGSLVNKYNHLKWLENLYKGHYLPNIDDLAIIYLLEDEIKARLREKPYLRLYPWLSVGLVFGK